MDAHELGQYLPRGGRKIPVTKAEDRFTAIVPRPADAARLRESPLVREIEPVVEGIDEVTVAANGEPERQRDELMQRLRDEGMIVHHEYVSADDPTTTYQLTDEVIIKFRSGVDPARIAEILTTEGVVIKKEYPHLDRTYLVTVTAAANANPIKVANRLEAYEEVEYAEPALINRFAQFAFPTDEQFASQWHLYSKAQNAPDIARDADANVYEAWALTKGTRDVVVAVLDDGFELNHPDFTGPGKVVEPVDFRGGDDDPLPFGSDYHGTPCAGVAIAEENGEGCVGVAPGCAFMPVRFPLDAADPWLIEIFRFVSARAHVASCSWGYYPGNYPLSSAVTDTFASLARTGGKDGRGLAIVFAAGNYDAPLNATVDYQIRWRGRTATGAVGTLTATGRIVNGLAAHPDVICVSAITSMNRKALYSNWGREVTVAAPSNNFDPTTNQKLPGRGITTVDNEYYGQDFSPGKRYTNSFGGTSSATPLVAGVVALAKSANPALTALEIKAILAETADQVIDESTDPLYGHQKGTYQNGHSEWFGFGKVNAARAVQQAVDRLPDQHVVEQENATPLAIPDFYAPGIASVIEIVESGVVAGIEVGVDIAHTWIGDLEVALVSPAGTRVRLHDRTGRSADNIRRTYTLDDTPALQAVLTEPSHGQWTLTVADRARQDVGTLNRWRLALTLSDAGRIRVSSIASLPIPDADARGVTSRLTVERDEAVRDLVVSVDLVHTWIGDLRVSLVTPNGREAILHDRAGRDADDLRATYDAGSSPALASLLTNGLRSGGTWTLKVADLVRRDVGKLNTWSLEIGVD